jgi:hypothetical protein
MNRDEFGKRLPSRHASWSLTSNLFHRLSITSNLLQRSTHAPIYFNQSSCATKSNSTSPSLRCCAGLRRNPLYPPTSRFLAITSSYEPAPLPSQRPHSFLTNNMADQPESPQSQTIFESALRAYEEKTGITLAQHPLAQQLQSRHSAQDTITLLQGQVHAFDEFRRDKILNTIKATVSILTPLSAAASLPDTFGMVRPDALMAFTFLTTYL